MNILDQIQTIVIVMMENRSFDHVLGHLSMAQYGNRKDIIGLINPETNPDYTNFLDSQGYQPFHLKDGPLPSDLPHSRDLVAVQLAKRMASLRCGVSWMPTTSKLSVRLTFICQWVFIRLKMYPYRTSLPTNMLYVIIGLRLYLPAHSQTVQWPTVVML